MFLLLEEFEVEISKQVFIFRSYVLIQSSSYRFYFIFVFLGGSVLFVKRHRVMDNCLYLWYNFYYTESLGFVDM